MDAFYQKIQQESRERYGDTEMPLQILPMVGYLNDRGIRTQQEFKEQVDAGMIGEMLKDKPPTNFDLNLGIDILAIDPADRELLHKKWKDMKPEERARLERYELVKGRNAEQLVAQYQFVRERIMRYMYFAGQRTELMSDVEVKPQGWWPELKRTLSDGWDSMSSNEKAVGIGALILTSVFALIAEPRSDGKHSWMYRLGQLIKGGAVIFGVGHLGSKLWTGKSLMDNISQLTSGAVVTEPGYWEKALNTTKQNADRFNTFLVEAATEGVSFKLVYDAYLKAKHDPKHELDMDELGLTMDGRETYTALDAAFTKFKEPLEAMYKDGKNHEKEFATVWALIMTSDPQVQADVVESFEQSVVVKGAAAAGAAVSGAAATGYEKAKGAAGAAIDVVGDKAREGWGWLSREWKDLGRSLDLDEAGMRARFYNSVDSDQKLESFIKGNGHIDDVFIDQVTKSLKPVIVEKKDPKLVFLMSEVSVDTQSPPEEQIAEAANEAYKNGLRALEAGGYNLHVAEPLGGVYLAHEGKYRLYLKSYLPGSIHSQRKVVGELGE